MLLGSKLHCIRGGPVNSLPPALAAGFVMYSLVIVVEVAHFFSDENISPSVSGRLLIQL